MPRHWTCDEDEILCGYAHEGARGVSKALMEELGSSRSVSSVVNRASLLSVSLQPYETCSLCGRRVKKGGLMSVTGFCRLCHQEYMVEQNTQLRKELEHEYSERELQRIAQADKDRSRERSHTYRLRKKLNALNANENANHDVD